MHHSFHASSPPSQGCQLVLCGDMLFLYLPLLASSTPAHSGGNGCFCAQGVEHNSEAALYAVSQGRGRSAGCVNLTAAETIAAQRCLRNPACSKALGHAGFCDNGKSASAMRHNSLAGLAAAAEQASNGSPGSNVISQCWLHLVATMDAVANCITIHQCCRPGWMRMHDLQNLASVLLLCYLNLKRSLSRSSP